MSRSPKPSTLAPRKAPSGPRSEQTVAILLEAAAQVLERDGLDGFNTNAVADRAGVSIGSLYQYFPGKDALLLALMQRERRGFHAEAAAALGQGSGCAALEALVAACVRQQLLRPALAHLLDLEEARPPFRDAAADAKASTLAELLLAVLEEPDLPRPQRPDIAVADLLAIVRGMTDAAGERGETDVEDLQSRIERAVFGYLGLTRRGSEAPSETVVGGRAM